MPKRKRRWFALAVLACTAGVLPAAHAQAPVQTYKNPSDTALKLDGRAALTVGRVSLSEGADFKVIASPGAWVTGRVAHFAKGSQIRGAVVLLGRSAACQSSAALFQQALQGGAAMVIAVDDESTRSYITPTAATLITVSPETMDKLMAVKDGESAVLAVHPQQALAPPPAPRSTGDHQQ